MPRRLLETSAHYHQTAAVASKLGIHGPAVTLSNACSSSGAAIAYAIELLRSGRCDWVLAAEPMVSLNLPLRALPPWELSRMAPVRHSAIQLA